MPIKSEAQLDAQALHRDRSSLVGRRTTVINQIRGFLLERGVAVSQGPAVLRRRLPEILASQTDRLTPSGVRVIERRVAEWRRLDQEIEEVAGEIEALSFQDEGVRRLKSIPGIGPIISSAVVAAIGNGAAFTRERDFSAWLGLVPRQHSTGDRTRLGGLSKRGNKYLRKLFIQGARSVLLRRDRWAQYSFGDWLTRAARRLHHNVLAAALANKLARITWAVLTSGRAYQT